MSQHTPGPWKIFSYKFDNNYLGYAVGPETNPAIAKIINCSPATEKANARLIAKAPEMLDLVRRLAYGSNQPFDHPDARAMHKAGIVALALLREIEGDSQ